MKLIIKEIKRLSNFTMEEMNDWYKEFESILNHNYDMLFDTSSLDDLVDKLNNATKL